MSIYFLKFLHVRLRGVWIRGCSTAKSKQVFHLSYAKIFRNIPNLYTSPSSVKLKSVIAENFHENRIDF